MLPTARLRTFIVALLIAAQSASAAYAAGALALGAPCPVHAALASKTVQADAHQLHGSPAESPAQAGGEESQPSHYGFNCCAGHLVGVSAPALSLAAADWIFVKTVSVQLVPATADLAGIDPPPRLFL